VNQLADGGFESGLGEWQRHGDCALDWTVAASGRGSLRITRGWAGIEVRHLTPGLEYTCSARVRLAAVRPQPEGGYAFFAVHQLDDFGDLVRAQDVLQAKAPADWTSHQATFTLDPECRTLSIRCGFFRAEGTVWFDDVTLAEGPLAAEASGVGAADRAAVRLPEVTEGLRGMVAILNDDLPAGPGAASPERIESLLREAGFGVATLDSARLADARCLNRGLFDVLVLPYGPSFPVQAAGNFRRFLRDGGKFLSAGGYAFDDLLERAGDGWQRPAGVPSEPEEHALWQCGSPAEGLRGSGPLQFSGFVKSARVKGPGMAYFAIYQFDRAGRIVAWRDLCRVQGTRDWQAVTHRFEVHPAAAVVEVRAGLYRCRGVAAFDDVSIVDAAGKIRFETGFEPPYAVDSTAPVHGRVSNPAQWTVSTRTRHSGQQALVVRHERTVREPERLNTRWGVPEDGLRTEPTQLGVFQADYPLERVRSAQAATGQSVIDPALRLEGVLSGHAAAGVVGFDEARWVPLINGYDAWGRLRGAVGAMLRHDRGPYAGSSWAFFGVTNRDVFAASEPGMGRALADIVGALVEDTYVVALGTDRGCYRQGEGVAVQATLANFGRRQADLRLTVHIETLESPGVPVSRLETRCVLEPGTTRAVALEWRPGRFLADFYRLRGRLWRADRGVDAIESGFVVWNPQAIAGGPALSFRDNYLRIGARPVFLFGTDDWSYVFTTRRETPLQWLEDMRQRRDLGVQIYENLQSPPPRDAESRERMLRKVDGVTQLAQQCGQVYFPGLWIGANTAVDDAELTEQAAYCREFARRYREVPGLIYYVNGDLRCELSDAVSPHWNRFLQDRYGTAGLLAEAWGVASADAALGSLRIEEYSDSNQPWGDVRIYDQNRFRSWLVERWCTILADALREEDPGHLTTAEFYQLPHQGVDLPAAIGTLDLANFGFFEKRGADLARFPLLCKYNDQRWRGKSTGPGEYGVKVHPAWGDGADYGYHTARTREEAIELFLGIAHQAFGLGASRIHNWCWKDDAHRVFPWGMVYPCDGVPRDTAYVHRNQSFLFRHFRPVYRDPEVYVLTPDSHRMGGAKWTVIEGILRSIELALSLHVDNLGTLNEQDLVIPKAARAIFYPLPFCPPEPVCARLRAWVEGGGVLYLSGDLSFDEARRRTRTDRLEALCGVRFVKELYPNLEVPSTHALAQPCIAVAPLGAVVRAAAPDGTPCVVEHGLGRGRVLFTTDPIEVHPAVARGEADRALYRSVLEAAGVRPLGLSPEAPEIHSHRVPLDDGGAVWVLMNGDDEAASRTVTLTGLRPSPTLEVQRRRPALLWSDKAGALRAVEVQGELRIDKARVVADTTQGILLSLDGADVRHSKALLAMPLRHGTVRWKTHSHWRGAVVEPGEVQGGRWRTFARRPLERESGEAVLAIEADDAFVWFLVCEESTAAGWREYVGRTLRNPGAAEEKD